MAIIVDGNIGIADTYAEITGYGSPTEGLIVFCKADGLHYRYNSSAWAQFTSASFYTSNNIPAANVTQSSTHRLVSDAEKGTWNGKEEGGAA